MGNTGNTDPDFCEECNVIHTASTAWGCPPEPVEIPKDARRCDCGRPYIPANAVYCWFCNGFSN